MAVRITQGTKEYIDVTVTDTEGVLTTLDGSSPEFDVNLVDSVTGLDSTAKYTGQSAINSGMMIQCLLDTNNGGLWDKGLYHLYVQFTVGSEIPRLGPFDIYLI